MSLRYFIIWEAAWKVHLMSSVMCITISSALECLIYGEKGLTKATIKHQFLEVFFMMHDFLDMPVFFKLVDRNA